MKNFHEKVKSGRQFLVGGESQVKIKILGYVK